MLKVSEKYYNHILKQKITKLYQEVFKRVMKTKIMRPGKFVYIINRSTTITLLMTT